MLFNFEYHLNVLTPGNLQGIDLDLSKDSSRTTVPVAVSVPVCGAENVTVAEPER